jgi:hypothetical protein
VWEMETYGDPCDNNGEASMMEYTTHHGVEQRLSELVSNTPRLMFPLRDVARDALAQGYDKDALIEDFERIRARLDDDGEEEREDAVMEVMDFLYGWSSPHMKL